MATSSSSPEEMRDLVRGYVEALHATYLDHARHLPPGERAELPLVAARSVTVIAAAARRLHLVATTQSLPAPSGPEVAVHDEHLGTSWDLRFLDPSVLPGLGLLVDDHPVAVRRVIGVADVVYHLTVDVGGGLGAHHAQHSGVALAHQHAKTGRDLDRLRGSLPRRGDVVDELSACVRLGLGHAVGLLVAELTAGRVRPTPGTPPEDVLAALLDDVGPTR